MMRAKPSRPRARHRPTETDPMRCACPASRSARASPMAVPSARARSSCSRRHVRDAAGVAGSGVEAYIVSERLLVRPGLVHASVQLGPGVLKPTPPARNDAPRSCAAEPFANYARAAPPEPQPARRQRALRSQERCMGFVPVTCLTLRRTRLIIRRTVTAGQINEKYVWIPKHQVSLMRKPDPDSHGAGPAVRNFIRTHSSNSPGQGAMLRTPVGE